MPSRNILKIYTDDTYYHIYNRGVAKKRIFKSPQDYKVFLNYLKEALVLPFDTPSLKVEFTLKGRTFKGVPKQIMNFYNNIQLVAYCLMPNHFHLLIKQTDRYSITHFMRSLTTRYAAYFNKHYKRVGSIFQGRYKAVMVSDDRYLLHLSRYIHINPSEITEDLTNAYSSYPEYLGIRKTEWVKPDVILNFFNGQTFPEFKKINDYKTFVENYHDSSEKVLGELTLE